MVNLRATLPPAHALVVFEAAGRRLNFTEAGRELNVTQAAVSRQIAQLEENLGQKLFRRLHRGLALTPAGQRLHGAVTMGLEHIAGIVQELRAPEPNSDVTIASSVTFASYWLMARLAKFRAEFPDTDIRLSASSRLRGDTTGIDFTVRYGHGEWAGQEARQLFDNDIFPVCAPAYLEKSGPIAGLAQLVDETLLYLTQFDRNWVTWDTWFQSFGIPHEKPARGIQFDSYTVLLHAALRGEGVALAGGRLAEDFIERGELVRPVAEAMHSEFAFYLTHPADRPLSAKAKQFRDWLLAEAFSGAGAGGPTSITG